MKFIIYLFSLIGLSSSFGQNHFLGLSTGLSLAKVDRPNYNYYKPVAGLNLDCFYQFRKKHFISKTSIGLQQKGFSQTLIFVDTNHSVLGEGAVERTRFNYLGLTELVGLEYGDKVFGYVCAGFSISRYLYTKVQSEDFELDNGVIVYGYEMTFQNLRPFDLAAVAEIGLGIRRENRFTLIFTSSCNAGITKIRYKNGTTENPWRNQFLSFRVGLRCPLKLSES